MKRKKQKEIRLNIRIPEAEKQDLRDVVAQSGLTETLVIRAAVKKQVSEMRQQIADGLGVTVVL